MASTIWRGYISFGLISIPVRLYRAARAEKISFRRLYRQSPASTSSNYESDDDEISSVSVPARDASRAAAPPLTSMSASGNKSASSSASLVQQPPAEPLLTPVQQVSVRKGSDEVLAPKSVVKGYEYEKDRFVAVEPEELKSAAPKTSTTMEIQEFVALSEIDPVYFETSYYVIPEEAGEKAYALLFESMRKEGLVALAQFAMHSREHVVVLRAGKKGLLTHTMFFASEVRADEEFRTDVSAVSAKELELAQTLVRSLAGPFEPEKYRDTYREKIQALLDRKIQGQPAVAEPAAPVPTNVVDIADALRRSLANLKKPAASDQESRAPEAAASGRKAPSRTKKAGRGS